MPMKSKLDINTLDERGKARVLSNLTCKRCGETKPATEFRPRVLRVAKRGTSYVVFETKCKACRAELERLERAANRIARRHDRTPQTIERVISLAANGCSNNEIASVIKCDRRTLSKHFKEELRIGRERCAEWKKAA